jgi:pyrroloquinoline quinone (PQQ) biosynthesis protein C
MNAYKALVAAWNQDLETMSRSKAFELISTGRITRRQYAAVLRQIFHNVRENPQLMMLATARFRGDQREVIKPLMRHALAESGHEKLALHDIEVLGEDISSIPYERPLPATFAMRASVFHMIEHYEPVALLGYMFHLEYTPTQLGQKYIAALEKSGIPRSAMTFLEEHAEVDVAHCKLMEMYCEKLVRTPAQLDAVLYMQRVTAELYAKMLDQAIETAERWEALFAPNPNELTHHFVRGTAGMDAADIDTCHMLAQSAG